MMKKIIYLVCLFSIVACKTPDTANKLKPLHWLVGQWTNLTAKEQSYENWTFENDSTLSGHSFTIVNKDTVFEETMLLQQRANVVSLTVKVPNQNRGSAVSFVMQPMINGVVRFENLAHDFPQRIHYSQPEKDSIHAWVDGKVDGKDQVIDFYFIRKQ